MLSFCYWNILCYVYSKIEVLQVCDAWNKGWASLFENYIFTQALLLSGNELSGHGIGAKVDAKLYGKDVIEFKSILRQLYKAPLSHPLLLAPGGFFDQQWYSQLLETSGHGVVNALSHHVYNLGGGMWFIVLTVISSEYHVSLFQNIAPTMIPRWYRCLCK